MSDAFENNNPLISIIIPMYNMEDYLERCLDSVIAQKYVNTEILLINDGSIDGTIDIAERYAMQDPRIIIISHENQGLSYTRNVGIKRATGEYITFVDSDDELEPDALNILLDALTANRVKLSMAAHYVYFENNNKKRLVNVKEAVCSSSMEAQKYFLTYGSSHCFSWGKLYHRSIFNSVMFPVGMAFEDIYTLPSILENAGGCCVVNKPVYRFYQRSGSITHTNNIKTQLDGLSARLGNNKFIKEHYPEFVQYSNRSVLDFCLFLMGRICRNGRKENIEYWNYTVDAFSSHSQSTKNFGAVMSMAVLLFKISPVMTGYISNIYSMLKDPTK